MDVEKFNKYKELETIAYIDKDSLKQWCPKANCGKVI